jgi:TonB-dependent SusC/RagA subfamily outer membrane receptor
MTIVSVNISTAQKSNKKITISGYVLDSEKKPVIDAMVLIDDKKTSSVTNTKGFYKVKVSPEAERISILTFRNGISETTIQGRTTINFKVTSAADPTGKTETKTETEEVVDIGYGTVSRNEATTSVVNIDGQNKKYSSYQNIYEMIKGEISGVQVTGKNITISGSYTTNPNNEPLLVVDGNIVTTVDDIQPQMVKSISLLRGASASIYGSRGSNGVLLINLLKGAQKK